VLSLTVRRMLPVRNPTRNLSNSSRGLPHTTMQANPSYDAASGPLRARFRSPKARTPQLRTPQLAHTRCILHTLRTPRRHLFLKVLYIVTFSSKYTRALAF
jgi:hypothetical protein